MRVWDIDTSDNFLLPMTNHESTLGSTTTTTTNSTNEVFTCIAFCAENQTLCAGSNQGNLFTWKRTHVQMADEPEKAWQLNNVSAVRGAIKQCGWGVSETANSCILVNCLANVYILKVTHLFISFQYCTLHTIHL